MGKYNFENLDDDREYMLGDILDGDHDINVALSELVKTNPKVKEARPSGTCSLDRFVQAEIKNLLQRANAELMTLPEYTSRRLGINFNDISSRQLDSTRLKIVEALVPNAIQAMKVAPNCNNCIFRTQHNVTTTTATVDSRFPTDIQTEVDVKSFVGCGNPPQDNGRHTTIHNLSERPQLEPCPNYTLKS